MATGRRMRGAAGRPDITFSPTKQGHNVQSAPAASPPLSWSWIAGPTPGEPCRDLMHACPSLTKSLETPRDGLSPRARANKSTAATGVLPCASPAGRRFPPSTVHASAMHGGCEGSWWPARSGSPRTRSAWEHTQPPSQTSSQQGQKVINPKHRHELEQQEMPTLLNHAYSVDLWTRDACVGSPCRWTGSPEPRGRLLFVIAGGI